MTVQPDGGMPSEIDIVSLWVSFIPMYRAKCAGNIGQENRKGLKAGHLNVKIVCMNISTSCTVSKVIHST